MHIRQEYFDLVVPFEECESRLLSLRNYVEYLDKALTKTERPKLRDALVEVNKLYDIYRELRKIVEKAFDSESDYSAEHGTRGHELCEEFSVLHQDVQNRLAALDDQEKMDQGYLKGADQYYEEFYRKNTMPVEMANILKSRAEAGEIVTVDEVNELARIYIK